MSAPYGLYGVNLASIGSVIAPDGIAVLVYLGYAILVGYENVTVSEQHGVAYLAASLWVVVLPCHLAAFHDELQVVGEKLGLLAVPVEIHADNDVVQNEGRLCKHLGRGLGFKEKLVVKGAVIADLALLVAYFLRAGSVGNNLKDNLVAGQHAYLDSALCAGEAADYHILDLLPCRNFRKGLLQGLRGGLFIVLDGRNHQHASLVGAAGTEAEVIRSFGKVAGGPVGVPQHHYCAVLEVRQPVGAALGAVVAGKRLVPHYDVEPGLRLPFRHGHAVYQPVEELGKGFRGFGIEDENALGEKVAMIKGGLLHG